MTIRRFDLRKSVLLKSTFLEDRFDHNFPLEVAAVLLGLFKCPFERGAEAFGLTKVREEMCLVFGAREKLP